MTAHGKRELSDFVRGLREHADHQALGIEVREGRTSAPGLRQDEMAHLMNISVVRYRDLEAANAPWREKRVEDFARILQLDSGQRFMLYKLALDREPEAVAASAGVSEADRSAVQSFRVPAMLLDHVYDVRDRNAPMARLLPELRPGENYMSWILAAPVAQERLPDWYAKWAVPTVSWLRTEYGLTPDHLRDDLQHVVNVVLRVPEIKQLWEAWEPRRGHQRTPTSEQRPVRVDGTARGGPAEMTVKLWTATPDASRGWKILTMESVETRGGRRIPRRRAAS